MINIDKANYLPCWNLYMDLVETINNPEDQSFYDWESVIHHPDAYNLHVYIKNLNDNMHILTAIIKNIVINITNETPGYQIIDDNIIIDNYMVTCENCGRVWDGYAQCDCIIFDIV
jgi:hypothetical protein